MDESSQVSTATLNSQDQLVENCVDSEVSNAIKQNLHQNTESNAAIAELKTASASNDICESSDRNDLEIKVNAYVPSKSSQKKELNGCRHSDMNGAKAFTEETSSSKNKTDVGIKPSNVWNLPKVSNYYFIDASSLNDDMDLPITNTANSRDDPTPWSNLPNSSNSTDSANKLQNHSEQVNDLKTAQNPKSTFATNKESLVVEIKEADSGDSGQHSPCPDNTKQGDIEALATDFAEIGVGVLSHDLASTSEQNVDEEQLSSLRQEEERRQGEILFQNSITQYSQHRLDGLMPDPYGSIEEVEPNIVPLARSYSGRLLVQPEQPQIELEATFSSLPINVEVCKSDGWGQARQRCLETTPIASGGVSTTDILRESYKPANSLPLRSKIESMPIVSGSSVIDATSDERLAVSSPKARANSSVAAWVVDMSDCRQQPMVRKPVTPSSWSRPSTSACSSLGYFVNLEDVGSSDVNQRQEHTRRPSDTASDRSSYCEFFVDLSADSSCDVPEDSQPSSSGPDSARKNIFSMFIDLNDTGTQAQVKPRKARISKSSSSSKLSEQQQQQPRPKPAERQKHLGEAKPKTGVFMFIESEPPVMRRKTHTKPLGLKRHSWNSDKSGTEEEPAILNQQTSRPNRLLGNHVPVPVGSEDEARDTPPNSHVELLAEERLRDSLRRRVYRGLKVEAQPAAQETTFDLISNGPAESSSVLRAAGKLATVDLLADTGQQQQQAAKSNSSSPAAIKILRLSDSNNRSATEEGCPSSMGQDAKRFEREGKRVTENSWVETKQALTMEFEKKTSSIVQNATNVEGDADALISESDVSSLQSSTGRSGQGSTEELETSTSFAMGKPFNRLGEDLLRMFLEEINPDVTIDVGGQRIRAHKCILSSRCQYFAAILSGNWIESEGNIISLQGYSYNSVHFALCHIYSGESRIPDNISIYELATLADMLCLEGLKEVIGYTLKDKYCHWFHKPCKSCAVGVLECMPLAAAYGLDEIYRKSLHWITRHFLKIWPTKEFATLPSELMDKCYNQHIIYMSPENVLQIIMDCDKLLTILPNARWAEPVFRLASNLLDVAMKYLTDNFAAVISDEQLHQLDRDTTWNISRLQDHLLAAAERLAPEQACKSYAKLDKMRRSAKAKDDNNLLSETNLSLTFFDLINKIRSQVEKCLVRDAARAARTNSWLKMDLDLRRHIQQLACLVILPNANENAASKRSFKHSEFLKEHLKERHMPNNKSIDLRKVKMAFSEHNERSLKQTAPLLQTRKLPNKPKTDPMHRKQTMQTDKAISDSNPVTRPSSWSNKTEVKSRYLEPRTRTLAVKEPSLQSSNEKLCGVGQQQRRKIMISSSDSSRNSSPGMRRAVEKKLITKTPAGLVAPGKTKAPLKKDTKVFSAIIDPGKREVPNKNHVVTRAESPMQRQKSTEIRSGARKPPALRTRRLQLAGKIEAGSQDSVATEASVASTKSSVPSNRSTIQSKPISVSQTAKRSTRSLESSTAASRSRAAAVAGSAQSSANLRKSLLDAAKAPEMPSSRLLGSPAVMRSSLRQPRTSTTDKKSQLAKSNVKPTAPLATSKLKSTNKRQESVKPSKVKSLSNVDQNAPKFLSQTSRSDTFLKDEPTILNKSDMDKVSIELQEN